MPAAVWHGTDEELKQLRAAIQANCECQIMLGVSTSVCAPHQMLASDQRALDGLVFGIRSKDALLEEEWDGEVKA